MAILRASTGPSPDSPARAPSRCENCGAITSWTPIFAPRRDVVRCAACGGFCFIGEVTRAPEELYDEGYFNQGEYVDYDAASASHARNFRRKLALLARAGAPSPEATRLLELGCASGAFLDEARAAGVPRALGLEVSAWCRDIAARRGHTVLSPDLSPDEHHADAAVSELRPNLVVAWDVWEHLREPASTLSALLRAADPDVTVALTTVDASSLVARVRGPRWRQFHPPTHLCYPTRRSLRRFLEGLGFTVTHHASFGYYRPLSEYLRVLRVRLPKAPPDAWSMTPVFLDLHDTQMIIARRAPREPREPRERAPRG
jgi:hypothetical protein